MDFFSQLLIWIGENESVLSGIAATIAIVAVVFALSSQTFGLFRSRRSNATTPHEKPVENGRQEIRYCQIADGSKVAWASSGSGYPLVRSLGWFTNLEVEWDSPISSEFCQKLSNTFRLIRYDGRGMGLSDRDCTEFSPETRLEDLEAVIDAAGVENLALLGMSEGGSTAVAYAHKYPERVSHLIVWGSFLATPDVDDTPQIPAIGRLVPTHWGSDSAAFHHMFTATFLPEGNAAQNELFNKLQRTSASPETAAAFMMSILDVDVRELAREVDVPVMVAHRKGDLAIPVKYGKAFAAQMPNARMELLEGSNHWMVAADKDMDRVVGLINDFVLSER